MANIMGKKSKVIEREEVVIRFSGDSGDGMQLTGYAFLRYCSIVRK